MIPESTQEQATLYVLGLLDADEAAVFERELGAHADLRAFVAELRDTTAALAEAAGAETHAPPPELRQSVLARIAAEDAGHTNGPVAGRDPAKGNMVTTPWLPWALAACLMIGCGTLAVSRELWRRDFAALERKFAALEASAEPLRKTQPAAESTNPLRTIAFCPLEPVNTSSLPLAAVLWNADKHEGELRVAHLKPPGEGKDYQLWVVEDGKKDPVSAGVVTPDANGNVSVPFRPVEDGKAAAFALSVERAGGSPMNQGPILFLGKL